MADDSKNEEIKINKKNLVATPPSEGVLSDTEAEKLVEESNLEEKYGNSPATAAAAGAARGLTFGLSDVALTKLGIASPEALREIKNRNKAASILGEVGSMVATAIPTGGATTAAKGAQALGAGVRAATKAGQIAENITAKALAQTLKESGKKSLARQVLKKGLERGAGSAVESTFYTTGQLISEDALGERDFNAENLIANATMGALLGGAAGSVFGATEAVVPVIKNNKIVDWTVDKTKKQFDRIKTSLDFVGVSPTEAVNLKKTRPDLVDNIPDFLTRKVIKGKIGKYDDEAVRAAQVVDEVGNDIGNLLSKIDKEAKTAGTLGTTEEFGASIINNLYNLIDDIKTVGSKSVKDIKRVQKEIKYYESKFFPKKAKYKKIDTGKVDPITGNRIYEKTLVSEEIPKINISATELRKLKTNLQKKSNWKKLDNEAVLEDLINRAASRGLSDQINKIAQRVSTVDDSLAKELKQLNLDYGTAKFVAPRMAKQAIRKDKKSIANLSDYYMGLSASHYLGPVAGAAIVAGKKFLESDIKRRLLITSQIEKANNQITKKISTSLVNFFDKTKKPARIAFQSTLAKSALATTEDGKKPKDKYEAYNNIKNNVQNLANDPDKFIEQTAIRTIRLSKTAPNTTSEVINASGRALQFINSKLPQDNDPTKLFSRSRTLSTLELAKFERYIQAIDNPMSALEDLESGTLTREKVEAIKFVYPNIYSRIQQSALEFVGENKENLSYQKRIQIGILLDIPTDSSLDPDNILALQRSFVPEEEAPGQSSGHAKDNLRFQGLDKLSMAEDAETTTQATATRKQGS